MESSNEIRNRLRQYRLLKGELPQQTSRTARVVLPRPSFPLIQAYNPTIGLYEVFGPDPMAKGLIMVIV